MHKNKENIENHGQDPPSLRHSVPKDPGCETNDKLLRSEHRRETNEASNSVWVIYRPRGSPN